MGGEERMEASMIIVQKVMQGWLLCLELFGDWDMKMATPSLLSA